MDVSLYKCPPPCYIYWHNADKEIALYPLSDFQINAAMVLAKSWLGARTILCVYQLKMEEKIQLLAQSIKTNASDLRDNFDISDLNLFYNTYAKHQDHVTPDVSELSNYITKRIHFDDQLYCDGLSVTGCDNPTFFYGKAISELTHGQIMYFLVIRSVYNKTFIENPDKMISRKTLK